MEHLMNLKPTPFELIKCGNKTIELRLYDEKRKLIKVGDTIKFVNTDDVSENIVVEVLDLYVFDSFDELYKELPLLECGYTEADIDTATPKHMEKYYSKEKQQNYGVVGVKIRMKNDIQN